MVPWAKILSDEISISNCIRFFSFLERGGNYFRLRLLHGNLSWVKNSRRSKYFLTFIRSIEIVCWMLIKDYTSGKNRIFSCKIFKCSHIIASRTKVKYYIAYKHTHTTYKHVKREICEMNMQIRVVYFYTHRKSMPHADRVWMRWAAICTHTSAHNLIEKVEKLREMFLNGSAWMAFLIYCSTTYECARESINRCEPHEAVSETYIIIHI